MKKLKMMSLSEGEQQPVTNQELRFPWSSLWIGNNDLFRHKMFRFNDEETGELVGLVYLRTFTTLGLKDFEESLYSALKPGCLYIDYFEVRLPFHRKGYGRKMINMVKNYYKGRRIILISTDKSYSFWKSQGFIDSEEGQAYGEMYHDNTTQPKTHDR